MNPETAKLARRVAACPQVAIRRPVKIRPEDPIGWVRTHDGMAWESWALGKNGSDEWLPALDDPATFGVLYGIWQRRAGHVFMCPCHIMSYGSALGISDPLTILALVEAIEGSP